MKKRVFPILIAMLMVFAMMPLSMQPAYADDPVTTTIEGVVYTLNADGTTATVTGYESSEPPSVVTIHEKVGNQQQYTVTSIGDSAFSSCGSLTSIEIPASVTSIGESAFWNSGLMSITFESGSCLTSIGNSAFNSCGSLTSIVIPASVTSIGDNAFWDSSLASITFVSGSRLTSIGDSSFGSCGSLTSIEIPASVTSIGESAFWDSGLMSIVIPASVTSIGNSAFSSCGSLTSIEIPASVTSIGDNAFSESGLASITFVSGSRLTSIGNAVFQYCGKLESITIPASVTSIGTSAFEYCGKLESITIPASVTSIGTSAFNGCPLTSINFLGYKDVWNAITGDGKPSIEGASDIIFKNEDDTVLQFSIVKSGETPSYQGATPTKAPDAQYKYSFAGWTPEITAVTGDVTYTATYDKTAKISIKDVKVALSATSFTYNGKVQKPTIKTIKGLTLKEGTDYIAKWSNASSINAGTYSVTITGQGDYTGTTTATYTINKAANPLAMKPKTATVKFSKLKKKAQPLAVTKVINFKNQLKDKKTYTLSSAKKGKKSFKKYFKINKTTGKITVKKGLKKGIYKVKVKVKAAGNTNYKPSAAKTVTFKVKVK